LGRGKSKEKEIAKHWFVSLGKNQVEIADALNLREATVSGWVNNHNWKALRNALLNSDKNRIEKIKETISLLSEQQLTLLKLIEEAKNIENIDEQTRLNKESIDISNQIVNLTKAIANIDKEQIASLSTYLEIMQNIFKSLQLYDSKLYMSTLDFQEKHIEEIVIKFG